MCCSPIPSVEQVPNWKRPREDDDISATMEDESWIHQSSKRMRLMDNKDGQYKPPLYVEKHHHRQQQLSQKISIAECHQQPQHAALEYHQQREHQTTGQQSSERKPLIRPQSGDYQNMNSLLGSLHMMRRRQRSGEAGIHQSSSQQSVTSRPIPQYHHQEAQQTNDTHQQHQCQHHPGEPQQRNFRNNVVSLRCDSKLY
jgi:hypothetical protein